MTPSHNNDNISIAIVTFLIILNPFISPLMLFYLSSSIVSRHFYLDWKQIGFCLNNKDCRFVCTHVLFREVCSLTICFCFHFFHISSQLWALKNEFNPTFFGMNDSQAKENIESLRSLSEMKMSLLCVCKGYFYHHPTPKPELKCQSSMEQFIVT